MKLVRWVLCLGAVLGATLLYTNPIYAQCENDITLTASVDNPTPYVGEQVIYTVRIVNTTALEQLFPAIPNSFERFWLAGKLEVQSFKEPGCGILLGITIIERVLFPLEAGYVALPPGEIDFSRNPVYDATTRIVSNGVDVTVQPLPDNAPSTFTGAVGVFSLIEASLSRNNVSEGEPIRLTVLIEGPGNIDQIDPPELNLDDHWRIYPQVSETSSSVDSDFRLYGGTKKFEWLIAPHESGNLVVPPIEFSYFNPSLPAYQTVSTSPIPISVLPVETDPLVSLQNDELSEEAAVEQALKPLILASPQGQRPLSPLWLILPVAMTCSAFGWRQYQVRMTRLAEQRRRDLALRHARSQLAKAGRMRGERAFVVLRNAMFGYFEDKWNLDSQTINQRDIQDRLIEGDVEQDSIELILKCLAFSQEQRFAPGETVALAPVARAALKALTQIDQELTESQ